MTTRFDHDVAILGGGSAGYAAAQSAVAAGLRVVVIENGADVGGLCILRGCMPTKSLLYAAEIMHLVKHSGKWGVHASNVGFDFKEVMKRKHTLIKDFADERRTQLEGSDFEFIRGNAGFIDSHTLAVSDLGSLTAGHFVIATGSVIAPPPLDGLHETGYLTSDEAQELAHLPESLVVLGGGPVAVEFAQFFARFGVHVTLLQRSEHILSGFDTDAAMELENVLCREGIEIFTNTELTGARRVGPLKTISFLHEGRPTSVSAGEILLAIGRQPNTASLNLERAGVATEHGRILADEFMRTNVPHIHTAGDCTGPHEILHLAVAQGETAAHNIAHPDALRRMDDRLLLAVVFTDPQVAFVGITEKQAGIRGIPYLTARHEFNDHGKSLIMDATDGFVKLLAAPHSGEIIGGECVGPLGGELIHEIVVAMAKRMTVHELATLPHYHPTLAEIWTYPAAALAAGIPTS